MGSMCLFRQHVVFCHAFDSVPDPVSFDPVHPVAAMQHLSVSLVCHRQGCGPFLHESMSLMHLLTLCAGKELLSDAVLLHEAGLSQ